MNCRHCSEELEYTFLDLGYSPPSNAYLELQDLKKAEAYYPLKVKVCSNCWLVQTEDYTNADELFNDEYAYFSSTSTGWLTHAEEYSKKMISELNLSSKSHVLEIASNDGYLLRNFVSNDIPCLGIEPTASTADVSESLGIPVLREFFGSDFARKIRSKGKQSDLVIGNNVYAHVPDINDFTLGIKYILKNNGTVTLEFPHLLNLIKKNQFDTIYHEHFSYLSAVAVSRIFHSVGLKIYKIEKIPTHGGSLRIFGTHSDSQIENDGSVAEILNEEEMFGIKSIDTYLCFQERANKVKNDLLEFLIDQKKSGKKVAAYGAAAKGNTLLNYAGIKRDLISFVCDASESKQNKFMPGSHLPILKPDQLASHDLDYIIILPWNISDEVLNQNSELVNKGVKFLVAVPELQIL